MSCGRNGIGKYTACINLCQRNVQQIKSGGLSLKTPGVSGKVDVESHTRN
jgi:hypothetical protein